MKQKYICYGLGNRFDISKFKRPVNMMLGNKPEYGTGLWASPVDAEFGWKDWCEEENFKECNDDDSFTFTLSDDANVIHLYSVDDLKKLKTQENTLKLREKCFDFEAMLADGIDAIEIHISEDKSELFNFDNSLYFQMYGWDCNSLLILNPDIIVE